MRILERLLLLTAFLVAVFFAYTATQGTFTSLESFLLQLFVLIASLVGSFLFGQRSAENTAKEIIEPHARSAFRRLNSLYESLSRVGIEIEKSRYYGEDDNGSIPCEITLARLEAIVVEQLAIADDALEDWRDIVPEDVAELEDRLKNRREKRSDNG
uniref:Uncharacterized protein n=1 Tax=Candidatus Kentrum sp. LPFa TaxID=2126335 RepID=A0A450X2M2_9GAMM|nr:MAG: hypothetical protein BECKLPF1236B_GA0070989_13624 [Candidatus Kentron sp. LPFa]